MLLIGIEHPTPRARYIVQHVLGRMLGFEIAIAEGREEFINSAAPKLWYGNSSVEEALNIGSCGWLSENDNRPLEPPSAMMDGVPVIFPVNEDHDPFAAAFYLLSRIEEYTATQRDHHDRFAAEAHFVVRHGMSDRPVVDLWALRLANKIRAKYPSLPSSLRKYSHRVTIDVDNGLKYLGRPMLRQGGAIFRDLVKGNVSAAADRFGVIRGRTKDPFDIYDRLIDPKLDGMILFFLVKGGGRFDHAADIGHPVLSKAIRSLASGDHIGLHPSYESSEREELIKIEKEQLEKIASKRVTRSRQHFLRWKMPSTLRYLESIGMEEEHSMGFSDRPGFRAGTCTPFPWYDLEQERETKLMLHPFATMDSAFHDRMKMRASEAKAPMLHMAAEVRAVNGTFISVWHDRFLSGHGDWKGWPEAFHEVIDKAAP